MAINLDKYLKKSATVSSSKINLDKYLTSTQKTSASKKVVLPTVKPAQKPQPANGTILTKAFPDFLGGGVYQMKVGDPSWKNDLGHTTYGGVETKPGYERADIFPVSLSGVNSDKRNITMEKNLPAFDAASFAKSKGQPYNPKDLEMRTATDKYLMEDILPKLKDGKITLREAQVKAVSYLKNEQEGLNKAMENQDVGGLFGSFADEFVGTANKIGTFLGKKTGEIANKVIGQKNVDKAFKAIAPKPKGNAMEFKVGAGLPAKQAGQAQQTVQNNINIAQKESANLPFDKRVANFIADKAKAGLPSYKKAEEIRMKPFVEENKRIIEQNKANEPKIPDNPNMQFNIDNTAQGYRDRAKIASEILGREIKPENIVAEEKNFAPHIKLAIQAKNEEKTAEQFAQATTMPIRWTIGQLARDYAMTEDELKGSNEKFIPTKDWEKLIYGEEPIQALSKSEDLYGIVARNVGIPAAILGMLALDLNVPGPKTLLKKYIEEKVAKEGIEKASKMGAEEFIRMADQAIKEEVRLGKITQEEVIAATARARAGVADIKAGKPVEVAEGGAEKVPLKPIVEPKTAQIESKTKKTGILPSTAKKTVITDKKVLEKYTVQPEETHIVYRGEGKNVGDGGGFIPGSTSYSSHEDIASLFGNKIKTIDLKGKKILDLNVDEEGKNINKDLKALNKLFADNPEEAVRQLRNEGYDGIRFNGNAEDPNIADMVGNNIYEYQLFPKNKPFTNIPKRDILKVEKQAYKDTVKNGGVTISLDGNKPTRGFSYSPYKDTETIVPEKDFNEASVKSFYEKHSEKLNQDGHHIGIWKYEGNYYLDVSKVGEPDAATIAAAHKADQLGVFDLESLARGNDGTINIGEFKDGKYVPLDKPNNLHKNYVKSYETTNLPAVNKGKKLRANSEGGDGSSKKVRVNKQTGKTEKKLTLPKKQKITYKPIEKPVDLRKKIKVERTIAEQSTPKRIQKDAIEKGLIDAYKDIPEYDKINLKEQAAGVSKLINNDYEAAKRIALGQEMPKNGLLPESVLIGVKNQALKDGDIDLLIQLATDENGVAKGTTLLGQRIKALDEGMEDDAFRNIRKVVENRKNNISKKSEKTAKKVREKAAKILKENKPNKYDWQNLVKEITCPTV